MPQAFENCVRNGGKVRTKSVKDGYIHICFINGKSYAGEMHHKVQAKKKK